MAAGEHEPRVVSDQWFSVGMKIAEHGVTTPSADDTNFVGIDAGEEESHGTTRAKRAGCNLVGMDASMTAYGQSGSAEKTRNHRRGDGSSSAVILIINMKRSRRWSIVQLKMRNTPEGGTNRAGFYLAVCTMRQLFTFNSILLGREGEGTKCRSKQLIVGGQVGEEEGSCADFHSHILEAEWVLGIASGISIFSRSE